MARNIIACLRQTFGRRPTIGEQQKWQRIRARVGGRSHERWLTRYGPALFRGSRPFLSGLVLLLAAGCDEKGGQQRAAEAVPATFPAEVVTSKNVVGGTLDVFEYDGHQYLLWQRWDRETQFGWNGVARAGAVGLVHSASCPCHAQNTGR